MANYAKTDAKFLKPRESIRFNKINAMDQILYHRTNIGKKPKSMKIEDIVNIGPKTRGLRKRGLIFKTRLFSIS